jgi:hypothetical protein
MQNFITSSCRVIKTLEHKNEEIFENIQNSNSHQVKSLHAKVTKLISNAKATYYKSKAERSHQSNPPNGIKRFTSYSGSNRRSTIFVLA